MDIVFVQSQHRRVRTNVTRQDGVHLSVPVFGPLDPLPHDLAHYVVELELRLADGFWGSVAAGAIFTGMQIVSGRQHPHAAERSRAIQKANRLSIGVAELLVDLALRALQDEPLPPNSPLPCTQAKLKALAERLRLAMDPLCTRWQAIPLGGTLHVVWPEYGLRPLQAAYRQFAHSATLART